MTITPHQTLASLVTGHHEVVPILEKYHLDFCCKGKRTLKEACDESELSLEKVIQEMEVLTSPEEKINLPFGEMSAEQLIGHILTRHHFYVKQTMPTISGHLKKVVSKHGERHPEMVNVLALFTAVTEEMTLHMQKEEMILFPRILETEKLFNVGGRPCQPPMYINGPVRMMEMEHEQAGAQLQEIRQLTNDYIPPADSCTTYKVSLAELKEFEKDLHQHVHLENYLLFPLAEKMAGSFLV